jgi:nuclear pore complex protein Nup93
MTQNFHVLSKITSEPPALPPVEHASAHILNAPLFERKYARVYLGDPESRESAALRRQIAKGAREALEEQYWDILERTVHSRPMEARLGGDPSISNKVRAFLLVRFYKNGEWEDRIEVRAQSLEWLFPQHFFLVGSRTAALGSSFLPRPYGTYSRRVGRGPTSSTGD